MEDENKREKISESYLEIKKLSIKDGSLFLNGEELKDMKKFKIEVNSDGIAEFTSTIYVDIKDLNC